MQNNQISGSLPREWVNAVQAMNTLKELYIQQNKITGGIPETWGDPKAFKSLVGLSIGENPLGGALPPQWGIPGSFPALTNLRLDNANLTGELPPSWTTPGAFPSIEAINIRENQISGSVNNWNGLATLSRLIVRPGNPDLCITAPESLPFNLCNVEDVSCLVNAPRLKTCGTAPEVEPAAEPAGFFPAPGSTSGSETGSGDESGDDFPVVAVAVPLAVGIPLTIALGVGFIVWRRRAERWAEAEAARKRQMQAMEHPFDDFERQRQLTSPFAASAFNSVNAVAIAPAARGSDETTLTLTQDSSSNNTSGESISSRCARIKTRSFELPRDSRSTANGGIGVVLPGGQSFYTSPAGGHSAPTQRTHALEMQPLSAILSQRGSMEPIRSSAGSGFTAGTGGPPSRLSMESPSGEDAGSPRAELSSMLSMELPFSDWEIKPEELEVMKRADGGDWELGSGGFGRVYKALRDGVQPVAVKVLPRTGDNRDVSVGAFHKEIAILRVCRDANIVQFQGAYLGADKALLVTEYMEGGDLMANIAAGRVNWWRRGRKIAIDVAKGLCFLHARRIVHFDLKSPNILLARDGTAKIADVGMAKFIAQDYVTAAVGTLAWSAPEMLWGAKCTEKADIYSYGIVLYEICTGEKPVRGQLRDVHVPEECPEEIRALILECLETRPSRRPSTQQLVERLRMSATEPPPRLRSGGRRSSEEIVVAPVPAPISASAPVSARASTSGGQSSGGSAVPAVPGRFPSGPGRASSSSIPHTL